MIHVPRVLVSNVRVVSQLYRYDSDFSYPQADKYWYIVLFFLFFNIYVHAFLLRVYYAIMSGREFIRANGESRRVDTEIALRANERTDARPRISRYTRSECCSPPCSTHYFVQSGNSKPEISRLRFYFTLYGIESVRFDPVYTPDDG